MVVDFQEHIKQDTISTLRQMIAEIQEMKKIVPNMNQEQRVKLYEMLDNMEGAFKR